jgi:hypothetical protein
VPRPGHCTFSPRDWEILAQYWHPVAFSSDDAHEPVKVKLLDVDLVVYRTSKGVRAISTAFASPSGFPLSSTSMAANSSACASSSSASIHMRRARRADGVNRQLGKASLAARTAWSTSRSPASGTTASGCPVAGLRTVSRSRVVTNSPSVYRCSGLSRKAGRGSVTVSVTSGFFVSTAIRGPAGRGPRACGGHRAHPARHRAGSGRRWAPSSGRRPRGGSRPADPAWSRPRWRSARSPTG